jgi:hypothetical protein
MGPRVEMVGASLDGQCHEKDREPPRHPRADQAVGQPRVEPGQDRGRPEEQAVKPAQPVEQRQPAFAEPLPGDPGLPGASETELVRVRELASGEDLLAHNCLPEHPGVAKILTSAVVQKPQPQAQENGRLRAPKPLQAAGVVLPLVLASCSSRNRRDPTRGGRVRNGHSAHYLCGRRLSRVCLRHEWT